ncbi:HD domain-containing protein [Paenibacillus sp. TRM 82003]|nr:HD domain-containing protein [Paenibacillus sp. TRM 82003]
MRNYMIGSLAAVGGVGGVLMFSTLKVSGSEQGTLAAILAVAVFVMVCAEGIAFRRHMGPIRRIYFGGGAATPKQLEEAYVRGLRFPSLAVRRIFVPHLLGLGIPACALSFWALEAGWLTFPRTYIVVACLAALLVAGMHALIEFFLTTATMRPVLNDLQERAAALTGERLSLRGEVLISIRTKFVLSATLIGTFPLFLFALAADIQFTQSDLELRTAYWQWAVLVVLIGSIFASIGAWLLSRDVQRPIEELQGTMREVQRGRLRADAPDVYADEFSRLTAGFNHMLSGLRERDRMNKQLLESYFATLAAALDARDPYTAGHSLRVAQYAMTIGRRVALTDEELEQLNKCALLHDIGKIGVRDAVLLKDGKLTDEEFSSIKQHPVLGEQILQSVEPKEAMAPLLPGVRSHHERYDGRGYPDGLAGDDIPLFGRIIAVADAYDAMTSDRPYRKGMSVEKAMSILEEGKETQWDGRFVEPFLAAMREAALAKEGEKHVPIASGAAATHSG